jgi:hypothetical protein
VVHKPSSERFYHDRYIMALIRAFAVMTAIGSLIVLAGPKLGLAVRIVAAAALLASAIPVWRSSFQGIETRDDGMVVRGPASRRFVPWGDVDELVLVPFIAYSEVRVKLRSGQILRTGLVQGRRMYWAGGASADVLGELNRELEHGRAAEASTSPPRLRG